MHQEAGDADDGGTGDDADGCKDDNVDVVDDGGDGGIGEKLDWQVVPGRLVGCTWLAFPLALVG